MAHELIFSHDLPFPQHNIQLYKELYIVEQWFRRIAWASLLCRFGSGWKGAIPAELRSRLEVKLEGLKHRTYLDCENSNNMVWITDVSELEFLLSMESIVPVVNQFTGWSNHVLKNHFFTLNIIRNVVAHNRAASRSTFSTWSGALSGFEMAMKTFKKQIYIGEKKGRKSVYPAVENFGINEKDLEKMIKETDKEIEEHEARMSPYDQYGILPIGEPVGSTTPGDLLGDVVGMEVLKRDPRTRGTYPGFIERTLGTYKAWIRVDGPVDLSGMLDLFRPCMDRIIAIEVGDPDITEFEYQGEKDQFEDHSISIVWPKTLGKEHHADLVERFFSLRERLPYSTIPIRDQEPKHICHPQVWFL